MPRLLTLPGMYIDYKIISNDSTNITSRFDIEVFSDFGIAFEVLASLSNHYKSKLIYVTEEGQVVDEQKLNLTDFTFDKIALTCKKNYLGLKTSGTIEELSLPYTIYINPGEFQTIHVRTLIKHGDSILSDVVKRIEYVYCRRCCSCFFQVFNAKYNPAIISDKDMVCFGICWIKILKNEDNRQHLVEFVDCPDYPKSFLEDSVIDKMIEDISKLAEALGIELL